MNAMKISTTLQLVVVLFVHGRGVYCPEAPRNELPTNYRLNSCESHSGFLDFESSSSCELTYNEAHPSSCKLIERSTGGPSHYSFERADVNFISMLEEEMTFSKVSDPRPWTVTCSFLSVTQAQQFYKLITRDRRSALVPFVSAEYLKNSNNVVLAEQPSLHSEGREPNVKIVVKNNVGDVVLLFYKDSITGITQQQPTKIDLKITGSTNPDEHRLYKLGFSTPAQALRFTAFFR